jgi:hypothetical protein
MAAVHHGPFHFVGTFPCCDPPASANANNLPTAFYDRRWKDFGENRVGRGAVFFWQESSLWLEDYGRQFFPSPVCSNPSPARLGRWTSRVVQSFEINRGRAHRLRGPAIPDAWVKPIAELLAKISILALNNTYATTAVVLNQQVAVILSD